MAGQRKNQNNMEHLNFRKGKVKEMKFDFVDTYNTAVGAAVAVLSAIFGVYWYLFAGYLILNILDWLTGWYKARKKRQESSYKGLTGIVKKTGYWVIILVAFLIPALFIQIGQDLLGIDLGFLTLLGWFTLAALLVNEVRSILENLVECGYGVPDFLIRGLAITEKLIYAGIGISDQEFPNELDKRMMEKWNHYGKEDGSNEK
jgi:toxin secretion/phage lysis holin